MTHKQELGAIVKRNHDTDSDDGGGHAVRKGRLP